MAKNLKINIKNTQIAEAINLGSLKSKLAKKKENVAEELKKDAPKTESKEAKRPQPSPSPAATEEAPRIKARSRSAFAESANLPETKAKSSVEEEIEPLESAADVQTQEEPEEIVKERGAKKKTSEELRHEIFGEEIAEHRKIEEQKSKTNILAEPVKEKIPVAESSPLPQPQPVKEQTDVKTPVLPKAALSSEPIKTPKETTPVYEKLGPTGRHIKDLLPQRPKPKPHHDMPKAQPAAARREAPRPPAPKEETEEEAKLRNKAKPKGKEGEPAVFPVDEEAEAKKGVKSVKVKEFRDIKPAVRKVETQKTFDVRDRHGLRDNDDDSKPWRKRRQAKTRHVQEDTTIRPSSLKIRIPIAIKDLAVEMKLKSSQLVQKLFLQGLVVTLNDLLEDETTLKLLGHEFGCEISIDTSEEERLRITDKTIKEEIAATDPSLVTIRPPVVAFMGHVDHGKTSLIDTIRKSNRAAGEAGAITQHIGAFRCSTNVGDIAILDTPGHEAFSAMRARGADVTDIVVLVVAGDEGIRQQTLEAINHAKQAGVTIVVAINKCDKPNFNAETVYRQLADQELLPEVWGGQTITVNCSAITGQGVQQLLEMLALQAEVLELRAYPQTRARGTVLESEMHKGFGAVATVLVQNGTLKLGDSIVFDEYWARIKTMRDEFGRELTEAGPSTPVSITGMSGLPEAGQEFIAVKSEREAREIAEDRRQGISQFRMQQKKKISMENLLQQASEGTKKILNIVLRADVQGSLEALKTALEKIQSKKAELNIIYAGVGEITESDVQLAAASKAVIIGFHSAIEGHAETFIKQFGVQVKLHDIIYHAIDDVKSIMRSLLDKIAQETDKGKAEVKAVFKSSHLGMIAGCLVTEGTIHRNYQIRVMRKGELIWKGPISSIKRIKEDVREVTKGLECGIILNGFNALLEGDILDAYEVTYISQEL